MQTSYMFLHPCVQAHVKPQLVPHHRLAALRARAAPVRVEPLVHPQQVAAPEALVADAAPELEGRGSTYMTSTRYYSID